jgi:hypothetical protein
MAQQADPQVVTARIVIHPGPEGADRTLSYALAAFKAACRNIRDGSSVAIAFYDADGDLIGADVSGTPTPAMQRILDEAFGVGNVVPG